MQRVSTSQRSVASESVVFEASNTAVEMLGNGRCRTTFTGSLSLGFRTLFGIVGDVEVGSAMVAMAMPRVDIDPQRTVTLVVPRREALLANGFNDTAGVSADIDMIISKISHISVFLFLPFEKEILSCINNSSFAGYLCVIKTILIPLLQEGGELR